MKNNQYFKNITSNLNLPEEIQNKIFTDFLFNRLENVNEELKTYPFKRYRLSRHGGKYKYFERRFSHYCKSGNVIIIQSAN